MNAPMKYEDRPAVWPDSMWPRCARCKRPVAEMEYLVNKETDGQMWVAICHGEKVTVVVCDATKAFGLGISVDAFITAGLTGRTVFA